MNVLSLFDGMSCGQIALNRIGVKYDKYYASEIKQHAIKVTQHNYPDTIQLGDVTKLDTLILPNIDLLIGGSPCQDFSRANSERLGLEGDKSSLFFEYLRILRKVNPKYFLLENVVMDIESSNFITRELGVMPVYINSSLVSAQNRERYYWTNIPGEGSDLFGSCVEQPEDKEITLQSQLEFGWTNYKKARCLNTGGGRGLKTPVKIFHRDQTTGMTTPIYLSEEHYYKCLDHYNSFYKGKDVSEFILDNSVYDGIRYMNRNELEKMQTVPKNYTKVVDFRNAADLLGDGWTVDVIAHIFKGLS